MNRREKWLEVVDVTEWRDLGAELHDLCPLKFNDVLEAMRKIVDAQRTITEYEGPAQHALRASDWRTTKEAS